MKEIYLNALDSLQVGINFRLASNSYSSRKHAILLTFHSIELFLKEYLYRINKILIYKNVDKRIKEDSLTVGIDEILIRLENIGKGLDDEMVKTLNIIRKKRNRIEHHRYEEEADDEKVLNECLKFIITFVELGLKESLENDLKNETFNKIKEMVFSYNERRVIAHYRLDEWCRKRWPEGNMYVAESPFEGSLRCPICTEEFLVFQYSTQPFCFWCNVAVDCIQCEDCCETALVDDKHECRW